MTIRDRLSEFRFGDVWDTDSYGPIMVIGRLRGWSGVVHCLVLHTGRVSFFAPAELVMRLPQD